MQVLTAGLDQIDCTGTMNTAIVLDMLRVAAPHVSDISDELAEQLLSVATSPNKLQRREAAKVLFGGLAPEQSLVFAWCLAYGSGGVGRV